MIVISSICLILVWIAPVLANEKPVELVQVYCFSEDLEAGFEDERAEEMCKALAKRGKKKKSLILTDTADEASVTVRFAGVLGQRVVEEAGQKFVPLAGSVWQAEKKERTVAAVLTVGDYTKDFSRSSTGHAVASGLGSEIEEWIRKNRVTILEKAVQK
jgi:hypothetical protein